MAHCDVIVIGAGHNGLVAAATLARAGRRVLVLEKTSQVGGTVATEEPFAGFKFPGALVTGGRLRPSILSSLRLASHGLEYLPHDPLVFAPLPDGRSLSLWRSVRRTTDEIAKFSRRDASRWPQYLDFMRRLQRTLDPVLDLAPPDLNAPEPTELVALAKLGLKVRLLGGDDVVALMRMGAQSLADFLDEWFESDLLKAVLAAPAVQWTTSGPRAPGTAALLALHALLGGGETPRGGMGAVTQALARAARAGGVEIRLNARVERIDPKARAVILADGERLEADRIVSNADPHETFRELLPPDALAPSLLRNVRRYKARGRAARIDLALDRLPQFAALAEDHFQRRRGVDSPDLTERLRGRIHVGPGMDALERAADDAKYGRVSEEPVLEVLIGSLTDPTLAPRGHHVMSILMQSAPYVLGRKPERSERGTSREAGGSVEARSALPPLPDQRDSSWDGRREALGDAVVAFLARYAPDLPDLVLHRRVLTPLDLEREYGAVGGHLQHGDHLLDQLFFLRPLSGTYRYATPLPGLYLCGGGTHPGGGVTGASGANAAREIILSYQGPLRARESMRRAASATLGPALAGLGASLAVGAAVRALTRPAPNGKHSKKGSDDGEDLQV